MIDSTQNGNPLLPYTETKLPNGFTLVHKYVPVTPIVAIDMWIHTGAIHDPEEAHGLSHFFEHMFFKGTERYGVGMMDRIMTSLGGYNNAATSLDYTHYYVVLPDSGWRQAMDVMVDSLLHPLFDPDEIERERNVIEEEIKRHDDNPWSKIYDEFISAAFHTNRYNRKVLGTSESLHRIQRDTFQSYLHQRYHPENTTICVVGNVPLEEVHDTLAAVSTDSFTAPFQDEAFTFPLNDSPRQAHLKRDVNQAYLLIGYPMPNILGHKDEYAMDLLSTLLGEGRSSRLYRRLIEELGIVSSVGSTAWCLKHAGLFLVEAVTETSRIDQVREEIDHCLQSILDSITEEDLLKAKSMQRADYAFSNEKVASMAHTYGHSRMAISIDHAIHYLEGIENATIDDIREAFNRHMNPSTRTEGLLESE